MHVLFAVTIFLGAALLFLVQPLFARMALPLLGGSPAVWNTSMVFYQATLLAGYAYAHFATNKLTPRQQVTLQTGILLLALVALPTAIPTGWAPPVDRSPIPWLLLLLLTAVGLPFFIVSATSPLLQKWYATTGHRYAQDPYFLYAASNLGSMLGLLSYPVVVERFLKMPQQSLFWMTGYVLLVALTIGCAVTVWRHGQSVSVPAEPATVPATALPAGRKLRWVLLAFAPSSLMLSVTTFLSTDIAAVPLLWVIPLAVYLLTFILVFAQTTLVRHNWMVRALPFLVLPLVILMGARITQPIVLIAAWHLLTLFVAAMVCHGELANDRPPPRHLTEFYLWVSVGGVLGGAFNALLAPLVFKSVAEYPLTLALACLLAPALQKIANDNRARLLDIALPMGLGVLALYMVPVMTAVGISSARVVMAAKLCVPALLCFSFRKRPVRFGLGVGLVLFASAWLPGERERELYVERSFFGIHRVSIDPSGNYHRLFHGSTLHGMQSLEPGREGEPLGYYHRSGPIGHVFAARAPERVALVGLGAGSLLAYAQPGQQWTIFEIDPAVERIARNTNFFTYFAHCPARTEVILGDARLSLARTDAQFDLIVLDAYNSDAVPVHLITREALRLYLKKLSPQGALAFHISNRYLDLQPVIARLGADAGLTCFIWDEKQAGKEELARGKRLSTWAVMSRAPENVAAITINPAWVPATVSGEPAVWTDDFYSLFSVFRWR